MNGPPSALRPLGRAGQLLVGAVIGAALLLGLAGTVRFAEQAARAQLPTDALYGLQLMSPRDSGRRADQSLVQFPLGREAAAADVRSGARIIAVNGQRTAGSGAVVERLRALGEPAQVTFEFVDPEGAQRTVRLTRDPAHAEQGFGASGIGTAERRAARVTIFALTMYALPAALSVLLMARRRRDPLAPWVALAMALNALGAGPALYLDAPGPLLGPLVQIACPLQGWASIAVLAIFPEGCFRPRWTWAVVLGTVPLLNWMRVESSVLQANSALLAGQIAAVAAVWTRYRALTPGMARQQIRWALFGFGTSLVAQAATITLQGVFLQTPSVITWVWLNLVADVVSGLANILLFGAMTLGLMRYRLYDADATISRSVAYGALTLALIALFAGSEKLIEVTGEEYLGDSLGVLASGIGAAIAAAMIGPLHHRVTHWAEHRFQSGLVHLRHGLPLLVADMRETATPTALMDAVLTRIERGVRAQHGASVTAGGRILATRDIAEAAVRRWLASGELSAGTSALHLRCDRTDPLLPLAVPLQADGAGLVGWLLLGPRPDGSFYGREERASLLEIAEPIARGLAVVLERERREDEREQRDRARDSEVRTLSDRLEALRAFVLARLNLDPDERTAASG